MRLNLEMLKPIIGGYAEMLEEREKEGWRLDFITFQFEELPGGQERKISVMREEIERVYRFTLSHVLRRARYKPADRLPLWIVMFEHPVFKYHRTHLLRDFLVNDGLHAHALAATPPWTRKTVDLGDIFFDHADVVCSGPLMLPHVEPITRTIPKMTDYALKGLKSKRHEFDELLILPHSKSEMPSRAESRQRAADYRAQRAGSDT